MRTKTWMTAGAIALAGLLIAGCSGADSAAYPAAYPEEDNRRKAGGGQSYDQPVGILDGYDIDIFEWIRRGGEPDEAARNGVPADFETRSAGVARIVPAGVQLADTTGNGSEGIGVNAFLWRAALATVAFMPLAQTDPLGGVIVTEWYKPPEVEDERFKINILILDRRLNERSLRTTVFRQVRNDQGEWEDAAVSESTANTLKQTIMVRAQALHLDSTG